MRRRSNQRNLWFQIAVLVLLAGVLIAWLIQSQTKPLDRDELKIEVAELRSYAAEARMLSEQTLAGKTTSTYFETETGLLADKVNSTAKGLDDVKVESGLEMEHWQSRQLAGQINADIKRLNGSFTAKEGLTDIKIDLERLLPLVKELEESLKQ